MASQPHGIVNIGKRQVSTNRGTLGFLHYGERQRVGCIEAWLTARASGDTIATLNARQKILLAVGIPIVVLADWIFGRKGIDAVVYGIIGVVVCLAFYGAYYALRTKEQ